MYICICNAIRESDLRSAARVTDGDARAAYAKLGKTPNCGQCLTKAGEILDQERAAAMGGPALGACEGVLCEKVAL